jgi:ComEC/Rec2-related protein
MEGVTPRNLPVNARVTVRSKADVLSVGDPISLKASLGPPPGPVMPGGYDFSFTPFYQRIGAVGFAFGGAAPATLGPPLLSIRLLEPLAHLRDKLRRRIEESLPGDYGHIAAALIMGDQRGIDEDTQNAMRASGLGHILSISGLHLALVAGSVFWLLRALLALSPTLALAYPIKKWAATGALIVATIYLGISGAEVATVRSYVMLGAILIDRRALTLRNVALAALVILVFSPESLLSISFQMSFAATIAVIATYEAFARRADRVRSLPTATDGSAASARILRPSSSRRWRRHAVRRVLFPEGGSLHHPRQHGDRAGDRFHGHADGAARRRRHALRARSLPAHCDEVGPHVDGRRGREDRLVVGGLRQRRHAATGRAAADDGRVSVAGALARALAPGGHRPHRPGTAADLPAAAARRPHQRGWQRGCRPRR